MNNQEVIIFGAGIAGLTAAHELASLGYKVIIYEKMDVSGGFARSERLKNCAPTEHSWRGYAPFYYNFFDIAKKIPISSSETVYDNLSKPIHFLLPRDEIGKKLGKPQLTIGDILTLISGMTPPLLSGNKRNQYYAGLNFKGNIGDKLSKSGKEKILGMIGPGLGLNLYDTSVYHIAKAVELTLSAKFANFNNLFGDNSWQVMKKPTSEAWFIPWTNYLVNNLGVEIIYNTSLERIITNNNQAIGFEIIGGGKREIIKNNSEYILAIDPFELDKIVRKSYLYNLPQFDKIPNLIADGEHRQISFQIAFTEKIIFGDSDGINIDAFAFPNSEFNITLYPQDKLFDIPLPFLGYWSGTACVADKPGKLFGLPADKLTINQFCLEVVYQITRSKELQKIIKMWNGKNFADFEIAAMYVWNGWEMICGELTEINKKWVNTTNTHNYRPNQKTPINNLFLAGAHTKTSIDIWSMEGAVESGKIAAKLISENSNINLHTHQEILPLKIFHSIDDKLYSLGLPSIIWFLSYIFAIIVALLLAKIGLKKIDYLIG